MLQFLVKTFADWGFMTYVSDEQQQQQQQHQQQYFVNTGEDQGSTYMETS